MILILILALLCSAGSAAAQTATGPASDGRGTATTGCPLLQNRTVAIKVTRLVRV